MGRGIRILGLLAALAASFPAAAWAVTAGSGDAPRLLLRVPGKVDEGETVMATGSAFGAPPGSRATVQLSAGGRWRAVGATVLRRGQFALSFSPPDGAGLVRVRAQLAKGRRHLATSPVRAIRVREAAPAAKPRPSAASVQPQPASAGTPSGPAESPSEPAEPQPYEGPMYWGAWIEGAPWEWSKVTSFEAEAGKSLSLLQFSSPFADCTSPPCQYEPFPLTPFEDIRAHGAIPFFSWGSQSIPGNPNDPEFQLADVTAGDHDEYIEHFAEAAAAWGHPFFLRFDWEMNGNWFPWGEGANGNQPGQFVAAWRHVHDLFAAAGATNATWVWCPFVNPNHSPNIAADTASFYPGDEYVDWTCLDGYNWGSHPANNQSWRTFSYLFGPTYDEVERIAPSKPMLIGETASSEVGGSKAQWIEEMFAGLPARFPALRGLLYFDVTDQGHDWPIATSTAAEDAFAAGVAGPRWLANSLGGFGTSPVPSPG
jgi:Glycosyl hydrolase family 26